MPLFLQWHWKEGASHLWVSMHDPTHGVVHLWSLLQLWTYPVLLIQPRPPSIYQGIVGPFYSSPPVPIMKSMPESPLHTNPPCICDISSLVLGISHSKGLYYIISKIVWNYSRQVPYPQWTWFPCTTNSGLRVQTTTRPYIYGGSQLHISTWRGGHSTQKSLSYIECGQSSNTNKRL